MGKESVLCFVQIGIVMKFWQNMGLLFGWCLRLDYLQVICVKMVFNCIYRLLEIVAFTVYLCLKFSQNMVLICLLHLCLFLLLRLDR